MNSVDLRLVYYISQEIYGNESIEKIVWNNQITDDMEKLLLEEKDISLVGLYGTLNSVKDFLMMKTALTIQVDDLIFKWMGKGMICWAQLNDMHFLAFIGIDQYFIRDVFEEEISEITLFRYLRDLCKHIILLPSEEIKLNWRNINNVIRKVQNEIQLFLIIDIEQRQLSINQLQLSVNDQYQNKFTFANKQGNIRCIQADANQIIMKQDDIENIFFNFLRDEIQSIHSISMEQYSQQKELKDIFFKSKILIDRYIKEIRMICLEKLNLIELSKIEDKVLAILGNHEQYDQVKKNKNDFNQLIQEYIKEFSKIYQSEKNNIKEQLQTYKEYIKEEISYLNNQNNQFLNLLLFQFQHITFRNNTTREESSIEYWGSEQLQIKNIFKELGHQTIKIEYFSFYAKNNWKYLLVLSNQIQKQKQYAWITSQIKVSDCHIISKFYQDISRPLLFHYEESNSTMYIFNSKFGISFIKFNEDSERLYSEHNVTIDSDIIFIDICYLKLYECFILIANQPEIFKWSTDIKKIEKLQQFQQNYNKVLTSGKGNYYLLSNLKQGDIFNLNNELIQSINYDFFGLTNLLLNQINLFSNDSDWFICLIDSANTYTTIQIKNLSSQTQIISQDDINNEQEVKVFNPFLDVIKCSDIKYGPILNFDDETIIQTQFYVEQIMYSKFKEYFSFIQIDQNYELIESSNIFRMQILSKLKSSQLIFYLMTRVSIQLCTLEHQILMPLSNGFKLQQKKDSNFRIIDIIDHIQFGILEKLILHQKQNLQIISIMGKQSSGKSYLLNRIFGTRFFVSSARCTDGIWMSISQIKDTFFIILDCEGLLSTRRCHNEEIMLLTFISSISDVVLLNQDLSSSRNLKELLEQTNLNIQISGQNLFKGILFIVVRDINDQEKQKAQNQLQQDMQQLTSEDQSRKFLRQLFNGQFQRIFLSNFENKKFETQTNEMRQSFLQKNQIRKRWDNNQQILRAIKILLIQIQVQDHRSLDDHEFDYFIKQLRDHALKFWFFHKQNQIEDIKFDDAQGAFNQLMTYCKQKFGINQTTLDYNKQLQDFNLKIQDLLCQRQDQVMIILNEQIILQSKYKENVRVYQIQKEIKQNLIDQSQQFQICLEKCSLCFLKCAQKKNHIKTELLKNLSNLEQQQRQLEPELNNIQDREPQGQIKNYQMLLEQNSIELNNFKDLLTNVQNIQTNIEEQYEKSLDYFKKYQTGNDNELNHQLNNELNLIQQFYYQNLLNSSQRQKIQQLLNNQNEMLLLKDLIEQQNDNFHFHPKTFKKTFFQSKIEQKQMQENQINNNQQDQHQQNINNIHQQILINLQNFRDNIQKSQNQIQNLLQKNGNLISITQLIEKMELLNYQQLALEQGLEHQIRIKEQQMRFQTNSQQIKELLEIIRMEHRCELDNNHKCDQICQECQNLQNFCCQQAGHCEVNQNHLCNNKSHFCQQKCSADGCKNQCQQQFQHSQQIKHDCLQKHKCQKNCNFCSNTCDKQITNIHKIHQCSLQLCDKQCYFGQHYFQNDKILKCHNSCLFQHSDNHDLHVCNKEFHQCNVQCKQPGICQISSYTEHVKEWTTQTGVSFQYKIYQQHAEIKQCTQKIDKCKIAHIGDHKCDEKHLCDQRCPECNAFCTLEYGHQGMHKPHLHRNKDQQIFTALEENSSQSLIIKEEGEAERQFQILESCEPETCTRSCTRRLRAHFHLIECKGEGKCLAKILNLNGKKVANHQNKQYLGTKKLYDEVLCEYYWDYVGWENPVEKQAKPLISLCNYYCTICGENNAQFCIQEAWHTQSDQYKDHTFPCKEIPEHNYDIDVQFIIDTTRSMFEYLDLVKKTVTRLMDSTKPFMEKTNNKILFSIISYKDHFDFEKLTECQDFSNYDQALQFVKSLEAGPNSGQDNPEAMLDGLLEGTKQSWRQNTRRFMLLFADAPPHGVPKFHNDKDRFKGGCPCNINEEQVFQRIKQLNVKFGVLKLNQKLNQTL